MFESIVGGLILLAIGGITFLAYHHPADFKKLTKWLITAGLVVWLAAWEWWWAMTIAQRAVIKVIDSEYAEVLGALNALSPSFWVLIFGYPAWLLFLGILDLWVTTLKGGSKEG